MNKVIESMKSSLIMPARPGMSRLSDEISPDEVSVAICTAREPGTLKLKTKGRKKGLKTKGSKKKSGWKLLRNKFCPLDYCNDIKKKSGWKLLKSKVRPLKKKKRIAKKKMGAVVKFKKGAKTAKRKRARKRLEKMLDEENIEALAREILSAKTRLKEIKAAANSPDATSAPAEPDAAPAPLTPPPPSAAAKQLSYDETWAEFRSIIYSMLRTTDPDTIPETILDNLDMKDVTNRMWKRTRDLLVKMVDGKSNPFSMLRPEAGDSSERREFFSSLEQGKVSPFEDLTFGALLNLEGLRSTDNEAFSGYAPRWENAVWRLTKAICESWDYDPVLIKVLSKGLA